MRSLIIATGLAFGLATAVFAQEATAPSDRAEQRAQRRVDHLAEKLGLTEAQKLEVQAIFSEQAAARQEMHERHKAERDALREQGDAKLSQVLSAEQKAQLDELRAERRERWQDRREGKRRHMRGPHPQD